MRALDQKLLRDVVHLKSQLAAVALVLASGIAIFVTLRSAHVYLIATQEAYYRDYRFAEAFVHVKRAPRALAAALAAIPGVATAETRIVTDVILDVPGLDEPATGRLVSIPAGRRPLLNDLHLRQGRLPAREGRSEVLVSEAFARANRLAPGSALGAVIEGRWQRLQVVGIALSPEYVYEIRGEGEVFPDNRRFGVLWLGEEALATAFGLSGAWNDASLTFTPDAVPGEVLARVDRLLARYGGLGAYTREDQISNRFLTDEITETQRLPDRLRGGLQRGADLALGARPRAREPPGLRLLAPRGGGSAPG
jgi:putative ABC transport system permease protein